MDEPDVIAHEVLPIVLQELQVPGNLTFRPFNLRSSNDPINQLFNGFDEGRLRGEYGCAWNVDASVPPETPQS